MSISTAEQTIFRKHYHCDLVRRPQNRTRRCSPESEPRPGQIRAFGTLNPRLVLATSAFVTGLVVNARDRS